MTRRLIITIVLAMTAFAAATAQNSIDELVDRVKVTGNFKYTSAVERGPKTHAVERVVKVLEAQGILNAEPFINAFKSEAKTGNYSESTSGREFVQTLVVRDRGRNRIYMLKATINKTPSQKHFDYAKITIIIKYR